VRGERLHHRAHGKWIYQGLASWRSGLRPRVSYTFVTELAEPRQERFAQEGAKLVSVSVAVVGSATMQATLQICLMGLPSDTAERVGDFMMEALLAYPDAVDPIVTSDLDTGELLISFEFEASGDVSADVPKALQTLGSAVEARQVAHQPSDLPTFRWQDWWQDGGHLGTVQYPVALPA